MARQQRGERRPETFAFLGFTHYCGWTRDGRFIVKHKTQSQRLTRKLTALRQEAWRLMHAPLAEQHRWYASILRGHYGYFGLPHNWRALNGVPAGSAAHLVQLPAAAKPEEPAHGLGRFEALTACFPLPTLGSLIPGRQRGMTRVTSREEPGAGKPPARICEGESRMAELLDHPPTKSGKLISIPYTVEMNDVAMMAVGLHASDEWLKRGLRQFERLVPGKRFSNSHNVDKRSPVLEWRTASNRLR